MPDMRKPKRVWKHIKSLQSSFNKPDGRPGFRRGEEGQKDISANSLQLAGMMTAPAAPGYYRCSGPLAGFRIAAWQQGRTWKKEMVKNGRKRDTGVDVRRTSWDRKKMGKASVLILHLFWYWIRLWLCYGYHTEWSSFSYQKHLSSCSRLEFVVGRYHNCRNVHTD